MAYFSNGSEGEILDSQCAECLHADPDVGCPIFLIQMNFNYDQLSKGQEKLKEAMEILIDKNGICQMKPLIFNKDRPNKNHPALKRKLVFGDEEQIRTLNGC